MNGVHYLATTSKRRCCFNHNLCAIESRTAWHQLDFFLSFIYTVYVEWEGSASPYEEVM